MTKYFEISLDPTADGIWFLDLPVDRHGNEIDSRIFTQGDVYQEKDELIVPIGQKGREVGFNFAAFGMIVTSKSPSGNLLNPSNRL